MAQKESELSRLNRRLNTLSIFRSILEDDVVGRLQALIDSIGTGSLEEQLRRYGDFTGAGETSQPMSVPSCRMT